MGILEFFSSLIRNDITSSSIRSNISEKIIINHLLLDFNSIIHVASQKVLSDINSFMQLVLRHLYHKHSLATEQLNDKFELYHMDDVRTQIKADTPPEKVIELFRAHFSDDRLDTIIITAVINSLLYLLKTFCASKSLKTLLIAIDGVPSKGKLIEQRQRRYMGAIIENYKKLILDKYQEYLLDKDDYVYLMKRYQVKWSRTKITPGTVFMHKLVNYLKSEKIQAEMKVNNPQIKIIISDMYEIGEGEKKITNYVERHLNRSKEHIVVYSPDADVILLCMLLNVENVSILRYNQQEYFYDLINITVLKKNISYYINNEIKGTFDSNRINFDLVCISTLFGNDFVPKIETLNMKKGFQHIMDAYLQTLTQLKTYLITNDRVRQINFEFLKCVLKFLLREETDFIKHNRLYNQYVTLGQIKYVFDYVEINAENLVSTYTEFMREYDKLKHTIKNNGNYSYFLSHEQFMKSLKKSINIVIDEQPVNITYLTNMEVIKLLKNYYHKTKEFPRVNINLNMYSRSINDHRFKKLIVDMNDYDKEVFKFDHMLDEYYIKFNAQPIDLSHNKINEYYKTYFGITVMNKNRLTDAADQVMSDYLEGILWVFNYYFNDKTYINTWYYRHERAPLLGHFLMFLESIDEKYFTNVFNGLQQYQVRDPATFFNPIEQLVYVSPLTKDIIKVLPSTYQTYLKSRQDPFLKEFLFDVNGLVRQMWDEKVCKSVDCHSIPYFNKCLVARLLKPTPEEDIKFLKSMRKVEPSKSSVYRSRHAQPAF